MHVHHYLSRSLQGQFVCKGRLVLHSFRVLTYACAEVTPGTRVLAQNVPVSIF